MKTVGSACNMRCAYCYEHDLRAEASPFLQPNDFKEFLNQISHSSEVNFLFHGGEPLLYPKPWMKEMLHMIKEALPGKHMIQFQTNGTLIDEEWLEIFKEVEAYVAVSISLDPLSDISLRHLPGEDYRKIVLKRIADVLRELGTVGVVSVAHQANLSAYTLFIEELISIGVPYLTINKIRRNHQAKVQANRYLLSETDYVSFIKETMTDWLNRRLYEKIQIQPFISLLSTDVNQICQYLPLEGKCQSFITLYPDKQISNCNHLHQDRQNIYQKNRNKLTEDCIYCSIYEWCGGGCLAEEKEDDFCQARGHLHQFIKGVFNEGSGT
nr:radical SAM protein [Heliobacterium chlorum]